MKIDKVIFSCSERFSVFWNLNAKIWKTKLGIDPICLLIGQRSNTSMSDEHGTVIEVPVLPNLPHLIQITWSKFYWPVMDRNSTYLIGDIDLLPLSSWWFKDKIKDIPEDNYAHLDADGITQLNGTQYTWADKHLHAGNLIDLGCPTNLPGHYHCAKGKIYQRGLDQNGTFEEELRHIVTSGLYNNVRGHRDSDPIDQANLWCGEELRSTKAIRRNILNGNINFTGRSLRHGIGRTTGDRLDKSNYDIAEMRYRCDLERFAAGEYVDLHCMRPFDHVAPEERERRWQAIENTVQSAWNDPTLTR